MGKKKSKKAGTVPRAEESFAEPERAVVRAEGSEDDSEFEPEELAALQVPRERGALR